MKRFVVPTGAILILLALYVLFFTKAEKQNVQQPYVQPYYIALGDSLAAGMGVPANMGYSDNYYNYLNTKDPKTKYLNLGRGGDTTDDLLKAVNASREELSKATIITVHIGINDVFQRLRVMETQASPKEIGNTYTTIANNLDTLAATLKQFSPQAKIMLLNYYNPFPGDSWFNGHISNLNTIIEAKAKANAFNYVDLYALYQNTGTKYLIKENFDEDPIHPNIEGYQIIAQKLSEMP